MHLEDKRKEVRKEIADLELKLIEVFRPAPDYNRMTCGEGYGLKLYIDKLNAQIRYLQAFADGIGYAIYEKENNET